MKKTILAFTLAAVSAISAQAQSIAYTDAKESRFTGLEYYDNNAYSTSDYLADVKPEKQTYQITYTDHYDASRGAVFSTPMLVKSRVSTRVVYLPECLQNYLYTRYDVSKWRHATNVTAADGSKYYEVQVDGKELRFDDMCNLAMAQPLGIDVVSGKKVK